MAMIKATRHKAGGKLHKAPKEKLPKKQPTTPTYKMPAGPMAKFC